MHIMIQDCLSMNHIMITNTYSTYKHNHRVNPVPIAYCHIMSYNCQ